MNRYLALSALVLASLCQADTITGHVVNVADGDTITILDNRRNQHKIRLAGIDAPEKSQAFGERSRESLAEMVASKSVVIETTKRDRYGRTVGQILLDGQDVNLEQVRRGMAWHYKAYEREQSAEDRRAYAEAEEDARRARVGLWRDGEPVPPWEFRRRR